MPKVQELLLKLGCGSQVSNSIDKTQKSDSAPRSRSKQQNKCRQFIAIYPRHVAVNRKFLNYFVIRNNGVPLEQDFTIVFVVSLFRPKRI